MQYYDWGFFKIVISNVFILRIYKHNSIICYIYTVFVVFKECNLYIQVLGILQKDLQLSLVVFRL